MSLPDAVDGVAMEVTIGKAKAIGAAVLGFVGPGVAYLTAQVMPGGNGIQGNDWVVAALFCLGGATAGGVTVYNLKNRQTAKPVA